MKNLDELHEELNAARAVGTVPRVHGNGFIQVDLSPETRAHFWGPMIPRQKVSSPIHDHSFGFTSKVLAGEIIQIEYWPLPVMRASHATHRVHTAQVRAGEDTILVPTGDFVRLRCTQAFPVGRGHNTYRMLPGDIHETYAFCPAISVIEKDGMTLAQGGPAPRVFVPLGLEPDNEFRRDAFPPEHLWVSIQNVLALFAH